jgi:hypothetical protein
VVETRGTSWIPKCTGSFTAQVSAECLYTYHKGPLADK